MRRARWKKKALINQTCPTRGQVWGIRFSVGFSQRLRCKRGRGRSAQLVENQSHANRNCEIRQTSNLTSFSFRALRFATPCRGGAFVPRPTGAVLWGGVSKGGGATAPSLWSFQGGPGGKSKSPRRSTRRFLGTIALSHRGVVPKVSAPAGGRAVSSHPGEKITHPYRIKFVMGLGVISGGGRVVLVAARTLTIQAMSRPRRRATSMPSSSRRTSPGSAPWTAPQ